MTPEQGFWPPTVHAPVDTTSGLSSDQVEPENASQVDKDVIAVWLEEVKHDTLSQIHFQYFELGPLLPALEQAGIIPAMPVSPNPFDPEVDERSHEEWWQRHPEEGQQFSQGVEEHLKALRYVYYGAIIGRLLDKQPVQKKGK